MPSLPCIRHARLVATLALCAVSVSACAGGSASTRDGRAFQRSAHLNAPVRYYDGTNHSRAHSPNLAAPRPANYKLGAPYTVRGITYTPRHEPGYDKAGIASWYGPNFAGRQTANGEIFDPGRLTAAHPTLPLPSWVRVTNLDNGRRVVVRVNDRGPFLKGRIIDLTRRAADVLGYTRQGQASVRVEFLGLAR